MYIAQSSRALKKISIHLNVLNSYTLIQMKEKLDRLVNKENQQHVQEVSSMQVWRKHLLMLIFIVIVLCIGKNYSCSCPKLVEVNILPSFACLYVNNPVCTFPWIQAWVYICLHVFYLWKNCFSISYLICDFFCVCIHICFKSYFLFLFNPIYSRQCLRKPWQRISIYNRIWKICLRYVAVVFFLLV